MSYKSWMDLPIAARKKVKDHISQCISSAHASPSWLKHYRDRFMLYLSRGPQDIDKALAMTLVLIEEDQSDFTLNKTLRDIKQAVINDEKPPSRPQDQHVVSAAIAACLLEGTPVPIELRPAANRCIDCQKPLRDDTSQILGMGTDCLLKNAITLGIEDPVKTIATLKEQATKMCKSA